MDTTTIYDLIIIGSGPAGLTASIYASRYKVSNLVLGPQIGGTIANAHKVENYPGFKTISGYELSQKIKEQVEFLGAKIKTESVTKIQKNSEGVFELLTNFGNKYYSKIILIASGTERRKLNIPGEKEYLGKGVSYCTNCDAPFFKGKKVAIIGGGDAAITGCLHVESIASKVYLIYRRPQSQMKAEPIWIEKLNNSNNIVPIFDTQLLKIIGDGVKVTQIQLSKSYNESDHLEVDGVFIEVGAVPVSNLMTELGVAVDETGYIKVSPYMETNVERIYAAGDITDQAKILQQMITAEAQGAIAASSIFKKLKGSILTPKQWG